MTNELSERFEAARPRLRRVAQRILGSAADTEDALQEGWLRASRAGVAGVTNLDGWLTTLVARICFDALKRRESRREDFASDDPRVGDATSAAGEVPEEEAVLADSIGTALGILLDTLGPAERVAFVLHDLFDVPFDDVASVVGRTPEAARQLASRARRRVRGASPDRDAPIRRHDELVRAFFAASRAGNFSALIALLDPNAVVQADSAVAALGAAAYFGGDRLEGAEAVANAFIGRARAARHAYVGDEPAAVWVHEGRKLVLFRFGIAGERIVRIDLIGDPQLLEQAVPE